MKRWLPAAKHHYHQHFHVSYWLPALLTPLFVLIFLHYAISLDSPSWFLRSPLPLWTRKGRLELQSHGSSSGSLEHHPLFVSQHSASTTDHHHTRGSLKKARSHSRRSRLERAEAVLGKARLAIKEAAKHHQLRSIHHDPDYVPQGPIYRNPNAFHRSFLEMEKSFKIYVYKEGIPPMFHTGFVKTVYSTEGMFIHEMKKGNLYHTADPDEALVYFLPFSVVLMVKYLYAPGAREIPEIGLVLADYIDVISHNHPYWNQSHGRDHLMVACHDWGPLASSYVPQLFNNSIRVLCNANTSEGFKPLKDATFPEINLKTGEFDGLIGRGLPPSKRSVLAFFAGRLHGRVRHLLLEEWKGKDRDVLVYEGLPDGISYESMLKRSKFCLCPSGYEVASPRVVEAIYVECIPVLISDGYVPPFSDVLNWDLFSIRIRIRDIPNIKKILTSVPQHQYLRMKRRVKEVQKHFQVNIPPKRYDVFHMTVHSIWLRRLNIQILNTST